MKIIRLKSAQSTVRAPLIVALAISAVCAQTPPAAPAAAAEPQKLEKFEVTGSRIKRLDFETPAPVETFSSQDMEAKGYANIGDFMQSLPFNSSSSNSIFQT